MKKDYSFLEKYRKQYESGKIVQSYILQKEGINKNTLTKYMKNNNWNTFLAQKNHKLNIKNTLIEKIEKFKDIFEAGEIRQFEIRKAVKCDNLFLSQYISENWNKEHNTKHCISEAKKNLFKNFTAMTIENQKKGVIASQQTYLKRRQEKEAKQAKERQIVEQKLREIQIQKDFEREQAKIQADMMEFLKFS